MKRKYGLSVLAFALMVTVMNLTQNALLMDVQWGTFKANMESFFKTGLGGDGAGGLGIAIAVIGILAAVLSFVIHKFNPQSRMPGWITCLAIGALGAFIMGGVETPLKIVQTISDTVVGWFGL